MKQDDRIFDIETDCYNRKFYRLTILRTIARKIEIICYKDCVYLVLAVRIVIVICFV